MFYAEHPKMKTIQLLAQFVV